jgi:hypothetical protein
MSKMASRSRLLEQSAQSPETVRETRRLQIAVHWQLLPAHRLTAACCPGVDRLQKSQQSLWPLWCRRSACSESDRSVRCRNRACRARLSSGKESSLGIARTLQSSFCGSCRERGDAICTRKHTFRTDVAFSSTMLDRRKICAHCCAPRLDDHRVCKLKGCCL